MEEAVSGVVASLASTTSKISKVEVANSNRIEALLLRLEVWYKMKICQILRFCWTSIRVPCIGSYFAGHRVAESHCQARGCQ